MDTNNNSNKGNKPSKQVVKSGMPKIEIDGRTWGDCFRIDEAQSELIGRSRAEGWSEEKLAEHMAQEASALQKRYALADTRKMLILSVALNMIIFLFFVLNANGKPNQHWLGVYVVGILSFIAWNPRLWYFHLVWPVEAVLLGIALAWHGRGKND